MVCEIVTLFSRGRGGVWDRGRGGVDERSREKDTTTIQCKLKYR